ncbi:MAG: AAA family ATPase [Clostridia bacterium]|nr:AAA family ATPase [Clostridia bacterium]
MTDKNELIIRGLTIDWSAVDPDSYLRRIPALRDMREMSFRAPVTFFTGENGSGKSTLLEAVAVSCGFNPEGGTRNYRFSTYDSHSDLSGALRLIRGPRKAAWGYFLRAESFYNVATAEEEYSRGPGGVPRHYHERSHGESFLDLAQTNFAPGGLYLLDEPEAALSPQRQLTLLALMARCAGEGSQIIAATHSPILLGLPDAGILSFDRGRIHPCAYEDTDSYKVTEMFIKNRRQVLHRLLAEDD